MRLVHLALGGALVCGTVILGCDDTPEQVDPPAQAQAPAAGPGGPQGRTETFSERRPGTTEVRPGQWRAPEFDPPSILDYDPNSQLVTEENLVPSARFPVIDIHSHQQATAENMDLLTRHSQVNEKARSGEGALNLEVAQ